MVQLIPLLDCGIHFMRRWSAWLVVVVVVLFGIAGIICMAAALGDLTRAHPNATFLLASALGIAVSFTVSALVLIIFRISIYFNRGSKLVRDGSACGCWELSWRLEWASPPRS